MNSVPIWVLCEGRRIDLLQKKKFSVAISCSVACTSEKIYSLGFIQMIGIVSKSNLGYCSANRPLVRESNKVIICFGVCFLVVACLFFFFVFLLHFPHMKECFIWCVISIIRKVSLKIFKQILSEHLRKLSSTIVKHFVTDLVLSQRAPSKNNPWI